MKVSKIRIKNFKRFTDLAVENIPSSAKLVLLVGPNGCGKSSLFDAFIEYYRTHSGHGHGNDLAYAQKDSTQPFQWGQFVDLQFHDGTPVTKSSFYFRSAYRNEADFSITNVAHHQIPSEVLRIQKSTQDDRCVSENYGRLITATLEGLYNSANDGKNVKQLREELIGHIRTSMLNVFGDLELNNISKPMADGSFYFKKGTINHFHFKNLSGGEKAAFDILLDLLIKRSYYPNSIFCIDEPELHMHTRLQAKLTRELVALISDNSQLWLSTHSLGVLRAAKELEQKVPGSVCVLDFEGTNFDEETYLQPAKLHRVLWEKFLSISLDDLAPQVAPKYIVVCEGSKIGNRRKDFDAEIYSRIFSQKYPEMTFVSGGGTKDIAQNELTAGVLRGLLRGCVVSSILDRDDLSPQEVQRHAENRIFVLNRRNLESYLFDKEILGKLAVAKGKPEKIPEIEQAIDSAMAASTARGNSSDDVKSAAGTAYVEIKRILALTGCGNNVDSFMRDTLSHLITQDTVGFQDLENTVIARVIAV